MADEYGSKTQTQWETELKEYLGVEGVSLFTNGHMALELAIQAMNLSGEVITTPFNILRQQHMRL